ncbi:MAG: quinone-dependent dihydroorotate dehydrogenase, partial [Anaerolineales bacterium]|nr:quinone-dependent dihydroorotate dehydrogenase [Anaerolineales bacterium]
MNLSAIYLKFVWPLLQWVDPEQAHERTLDALEMAQSTAVSRFILHQIAGSIPLNPVVIAGLTFPNVLGIAAGFDKDVRVARGLGELGFGHIEVGTLTPRPQKGNPKPRIFRLPADGAVINRMGFPNGGVDTAVPRLHRLAQQERDFVVGVSLGKQKETPLADAGRDYTAVMRAVYPYADYLAVNISSPNTPGLRELQGGNYLGQLLHTLVAERDKLAARGGGTRPLFLKIAPDVTHAELDEILQAALDQNVDGMIATNTTL